MPTTDQSTRPATGTDRILELFSMQDDIVVVTESVRRGIGA